MVGSQQKVSRESEEPMPNYIKSVIVLLAILLAGCTTVDKKDYEADLTPGNGEEWR